MRTPEGREQAGPGDVVFFPPGPEGAHQVLNESDAPAKVVMFSDVVTPTATAYPDSGKVGVYTGLEGEDVMVRRADSVPYFHGEER